jgi:hypothetical protein
MARLTAAQRAALPKSDFAVPSRAPGPGSYPIPNAAHAAVAKGRATQFGTPAVKAAVKSKVAQKFPARRTRKKFASAAEIDQAANTPGRTVRM